MQTTRFEYGRAFARNLGLVNEQEQTRLRKTGVALPGLGAVGGTHVQTLARMGVGSFQLADPDAFEIVNFNRQLGAGLGTVGRNKAAAMADVALDINPEAKVTVFSEGILPGNISAFLSGVDVVVDGLEFFSIQARRMLPRACRERCIPVIVAGPIGYGAAVLVFMPEGPSFEAHFGIGDEMTRAEQLLALALGLAPGLAGDIDPSRVDVGAENGPVLASACMLCAAAAATEVLKLVCRRGRLSTAPRGTYYDPYRGRTYNLRPRPALNRTLRGRLLRWLAFRRYPAFLAMHERERAQRSHGSAPLNRKEAPCTQPAS